MVNGPGILDSQLARHEAILPAPRRRVKRNGQKYGLTLLFCSCGIRPAKIEPRRRPSAGFSPRFVTTVRMGGAAAPPYHPRWAHSIFRRFSLDNSRLYANLSGVRTRKVWRDGGTAKREKPCHIEGGEKLGNPDFGSLPAPKAQLSHGALIFKLLLFPHAAAESRAQPPIIKYSIHLVCFMISSSQACHFASVWPFLMRINPSGYP